MPRKPKTMPAQISDMELMLRLARESLEKYGTALPPAEAFAPKPEPVDESKRLLEGFAKLLGVAQEKKEAIAPSPEKKPERKKTERKPHPNDTTDWRKVEKLCPRCGETKHVDPGFGVRMDRGRVYPQPWCKKCRSEKNYHTEPRKNRVASPSGRRTQ